MAKKPGKRKAGKAGSKAKSAKPKRGTKVLVRDSAKKNISAAEYNAAPPPHEDIGSVLAEKDDPNKDSFKDEVGGVVEQVHEEVEQKNLSDSYSSSSSDYLNKENESYDEEGEDIIPMNEEVLPEEDFVAHRLRKETDPREHVKGNKYNSPWDNAFMTYLNEGVKNRMKKASIFTKKTLNNAWKGTQSVYHHLYGWVYKKE